MSASVPDLASRRDALVARAALERAGLARELEPWRRPLALASRGLSVIRTVTAHPAWLIGGALLPAALSPGRLGSWFRRGVTAVQLLRQLRPAASRANRKS